MSAWAAHLPLDWHQGRRRWREWAKLRVWGCRVCVWTTWGITMGSRSGPSAQRSGNGGRGAAQQCKGTALCPWAMGSGVTVGECMRGGPLCWWWALPMHRHWAGRGGRVWDRACSAGPAACGLWHGMCCGVWCASPIPVPHAHTYRQWNWCGRSSSGLREFEGQFSVDHP